MASRLLGNYWQQAGEALGFSVEAPYFVTLPDGHIIEFSARLPDFGDVCGMLLSDRYEEFSAYTDELIAAGYGFSVLSAPSDAQDLETIVDVLQDWGWSASTPSPKWLTGDV